MKKNSSIILTRQSVNIYIPPLNLGSIIEEGKQIKNLEKKSVFNSKSKVQIQRLSKNESFIRQKSLYRYYISKNCSNNQIMGAKSKKSISKTFELNQRQLGKGGNKKMSESMPQQQSNEDYICKRKQSINKNKHFKRSSKIFASSTSLHLINNKTSNKNINQFQMNENQKYQNAENNNTKLQSIIEAKNRQIQALKCKLKSKDDYIYELEMKNKKENMELLQANQIINSLRQQINKVNQKQFESEILQKISDKLREHQKYNQILQTQIKYSKLENHILKKQKYEFIQLKEELNQIRKQKTLLEQKLKALANLRVKKQLKCVTNDEHSIDFSLSSQEMNEKTILITQRKPQKKILKNKEQMSTIDRTVRRL